MESRRARIQLLQTQKYKGIIVSNDLCKEWGIDNKKQIYVRLGQRIVLTRLLKTNRKDAQITIPTSLKSELGIPFGGSFHVKLEDDVLRIGPVVGILTTGITLSGNQLISKRAPFFQHLLSAQREESLFYFLFTPTDVNWENKTVNGLFLVQESGSSNWRRAIVPFPDVVYNRIPDRHTEKTGIVQGFKERLEQLTNAKMFNPTFFNKWSIHQLLIDHPFASRHIPETYLTPKYQTIQRMLHKYRTVYLKPVGGSLGLGILKLTYSPGLGYFCRYNNGTQNILQRYNSLQALMAARISRSRLGTYLVQQGIPLIKYGGRPLDFRVHVHKNRENQWVVAAIAAKIAGEGSVTTHIRTGGTVISGSELLKRVFKDDSDRIKELMETTAIQLAATIESKVKQNIGELGFDLGIDEKGQIWMFEANSRPGRSIFKFNTFKEEDQHSIRLIVDYSKYLANFN